MDRLDLTTGVHRQGTFVTEANRMQANTESTRPHIDPTDHGASSAWNSPHRRSDAQDYLEGEPHVSMDYGFSSEKGSEEQVAPMVVISDRRHKMTRTMLVPREESKFQRTAMRAAKFIDQPEHTKM